MHEQPFKQCFKSITIYNNAISGSMDTNNHMIRIFFFLKRKGNTLIINKDKIQQTVAYKSFLLKY